MSLVNSRIKAANRYTYYSTTAGTKLYSKTCVLRLKVIAMCDKEREIIK